MNKSSVQNLIRNYSIETTIPQAARVDRFSDTVPAGTCLYIAHIPGTNFQDTVALAARLRGEGMEPVPHVVGRRIANLEALEDFLIVKSTPSAPSNATAPKAVALRNGKAKPTVAAKRAAKSRAAAKPVAPRKSRTKVAEALAQV